MGRKKRGLWRSKAVSGSPFHHAVDGEALGAKPLARATSVGLMRKQHTYINARVTSVSWLPLGIKERKHIRLDKQK